MKTKGLAVLDGYVYPASIESARGHGLIPPQFWNRLKARITALGELDAFREEADLAKPNGYGAEAALFARWAKRTGFQPPPGHYDGTLLWPWTRGWTEALVDSYLTEPLPARPPVHLEVVR